MWRQRAESGQTARAARGGWRLPGATDAGALRERAERGRRDTRHQALTNESAAMCGLETILGLASSWPARAPLSGTQRAATYIIAAPHRVLICRSAPTPTCACHCSRKSRGSGGGQGDL